MINGQQIAAHCFDTQQSLLLILLARSFGKTDFNFSTWIFQEIEFSNFHSMSHPELWELIIDHFVADRILQSTLPENWFQFRAAISTTKSTFSKYYKYLFVQVDAVFQIDNDPEQIYFCETKMIPDQKLQIHFTNNHVIRALPKNSKLAIILLQYSAVVNLIICGDTKYATNLLGIPWKYWWCIIPQR